MKFAHILSIFEIAFRRNIDKMTGMKLDYLKHSLGIFNMFVYFCCILFTQFSKEMDKQAPWKIHESCQANEKLQDHGGIENFQMMSKE